MGILDIFFGGRTASIAHTVQKAAKLTSEGTRYGERGDLDEAIICFRTAISSKRDYLPAYLGLAVAYREKGEYIRALKVLDAAPSQMNAGEPIDCSFEIAFAKVLHFTELQRTGQGNLTNLVNALENARLVGQQKTTISESQKSADRSPGRFLPVPPGRIESRLIATYLGLAGVILIEITGPLPAA
jgi:hypothetical protein